MVNGRISINLNVYKTKTEHNMNMKSSNTVGTRVSTRSNNFTQDTPFLLLPSSFLDPSLTLIHLIIPFFQIQPDIYQLTHTTSGKTPLIISQCPSALSCCHFSNKLVSFRLKTPSFSASATLPLAPLSRSSSVTSHLGNKKASLLGELRRSREEGLRKVISWVEDLVQKMTMLVKSRPL